MKLFDEYSKTGYGRRTMFPAFLSCKEENNLLAPLTLGDAFWKKDAENTDQITFTENNEMKISASGAPYIKWFDVEPKTWYFLNFTGYVLAPTWTDIQFGIVDSDKKPFNNYQKKHEKSFYVYEKGIGPELTIFGQDGSSYSRTNAFYSGSNSRLGFYAYGNEGYVALSDVKIFKTTDASVDGVKEVSCLSTWVEDSRTCDKEFNEIPDMKFFEQFENYGDFINLDGDVLKYKTDRPLSCYYFAWLPTEADNVYTFCFNYSVKKAGKAKFGILNEAPDGKRTWLVCKDAASEGDFDIADMFVIAPGNKTAFAVFDGDGEVDFSNFYVFKFGKGNGREVGVDFEIE